MTANIENAAANLKAAVEEANDLGYYSPGPIDRSIAIATAQSLLGIYEALVVISGKGKGIKHVSVDALDVDEAILRLAHYENDLEDEAPEQSNTTFVKRNDVARAIKYTGDNDAEVIEFINSFDGYAAVVGTGPEKTLGIIDGDGEHQSLYIDSWAFKGHATRLRVEGDAWVTSNYVGVTTDDK